MVRATALCSSVLPRAASARVEGGAQLIRARRELTAARNRAARSERLRQSAERVSALSLLAFREGCGGAAECARGAAHIP